MNEALIRHDNYFTNLKEYEDQWKTFISGTKRNRTKNRFFFMVLQNIMKK